MLHSLVLYYRNINNQLAAEFMRLTADGLIDRVFAHYSDCSCDGDRAYSSQNAAPHRERKSKIQNPKSKRRLARKQQSQHNNPRIC